MHTFFDKSASHQGTENIGMEVGRIKIYESYVPFLYFLLNTFSMNYCEALENDYALLGCVATDPDSIIEHAYSRQIQTDPLKAPHYLTALCHIAEDSGSIELQTTIAHARSIGQYSSEEEAEAYSAILSYPPTSALSEIGDEVICEAFQQKYDLCHTKTSKQSLRQSLNFLAKIRKSDLLSGVYASTAEQEKPAMTLEKAYETLQASAAVDDFLLVTAYDINVSPIFLDNV